MNIIEKFKALIIKVGDWIFGIKAVEPIKPTLMACKSKSKSKRLKRK